MHTSTYFRRTLFYDQSPATDEHFLRVSSKLFENDNKKSHIEARIFLGPDEPGLENAVHVPNLAQQCETSGETKASPDYVEQKAHNLGSIKSSSELTADDTFYETDSTTGPVPAIDQYQPGQTGPPVYVGREKLISYNIIGEDQLKDLEASLLHQRTSYSRLQITQSLFETLLTSCHVFPRFKEFVLGFGIRYNEQENGPPRFKFSPLVSRRNNDFHGFECAYVLRYVEFTNRGGGKEPWSPRQMAVYHRYKPLARTSCSTWILIGVSERAKMRLDRYSRSIPDIQNANPFEIHLIFVDTTLASWAPYIVDLTINVQRLADKALLAMIEDDKDFKFLDYDQEQELKQVEDRVVDVTVSLNSTLDTLTTLLDMYGHFSKQTRECLEKSAVYDWDAITFALREKMQEVNYMKQNVDALSSKLQSTKGLISTLLDRANGHNLKLLGEEARQENILMRQLAEKGTRDSSVVKTLTVITLIYLPATVVSNFYSTQFVSQEHTGDSYAVVYSRNVWIFFAISIPLTLFTLGLVSMGKHDLAPAPY
ncbi:hypothetical protein AOQ84DRAFT_440040 [Glonium stellatum]|uniref:CorA-like transporter domain-containing protein n=1 Tax=Glonium stellatum TaxID=574774 RepID=A0A8E2JSB5_9PEZI|nr:hypothetical protein AOQ84DRAFT_440040 [Glonium stellatum]